MTDQTPDHPITDPKANVDAGFQYVRPTQVWAGNADPRNLAYEPEGLRYFGPGYEQPNDTPWPNTLPPPVNESWTTNSPVWTQQPGSMSPSGSGGKKRSWFARHKIWTARADGVAEGVKAGAGLIAAERQRQVGAEGWTPEHDDEHRRGELADAALLYLAQAQYGQHGTRLSDLRTPAQRWIKSCDRERALIKAGALIAAELDRIARDPRRPE